MSSIFNAIGWFFSAIWSVISWVLTPFKYLWRGFAFVWSSFWGWFADTWLGDYFAAHPTLSKIVVAALSVIAGIGLSFAVYWVLNKIAELLPKRAERVVKPYLYILPAYAAISLYLLYPGVLTVINSFRDKYSKEFVGLDNYSWMWNAGTKPLINTLLWIIIVPVGSIVLGLIVATLADRLSGRWENVAKSVIFLPMAVSLVGASTVWRFVYGYNPKGQAQTGILNAVVTSFGHDPIPWDQQTTLRFNSLLLMVILLWAQAGFSMVLLSAAIKGVPQDTIEAGRIDGASPYQSFFRIVLPQIRGTIITLLVTSAITVMKVFDVVYVTTNGRFNTNVIANMFWEQFSVPSNGRASSVVVLLLVAVIPIMIFQIYDFKKQEAMR